MNLLTGVPITANCEDVKPRLPAALGSVSGALLRALKRTPAPIPYPSIESAHTRNGNLVTMFGWHRRSHDDVSFGHVARSRHDLGATDMSLLQGAPRVGVSAMRDFMTFSSKPTPGASRIATERARSEGRSNPNLLAVGCCYSVRER